MTVASTAETPTKYQCIYCSTPCASLYRVYGASAAPTIKLSRCVHCKRDVDPYCERELMLVVLDCLLFREEAYRHLFFHRYRDLQFDAWESKIILLLASSCLRAYLISVAQYGPPEDDFFRFAFYFLEQTVLSAVIYYMHTWFLALCLFSSAKLTDEYAPLSSCSSSVGASEELFTQMYLSVLLPTACHGATIFVQIWEDSDTVRTMGSCLILAYQWFALNTILRGRLGASSASQAILFTILFVVSLMMRDVSLELARILLIVRDEVPSTICAGLELKIDSLRLPFVTKALEIPYICLA